MNQDALNVFLTFSGDVNAIFTGRLKALYAYGSVVYGDLHIGYSDLDFFAVVSCEITDAHFNALLEYRKKLRSHENKLYGMLEGEFVPDNLLAKRIGGNVAYWGTSGERMKNRYDLSGFSMRGLLGKGVLIFGEDVRAEIPCPSDNEMRGQVLSLINTVRKYAVVTDDSVHSPDWLFLICQSLYWLKTGEVTCKTIAAQWVQENDQCDWCAELTKALWVRSHPVDAANEECKQWLTSLGEQIQNACNTLEKEYTD